MFSSVCTVLLLRRDVYRSGPCIRTTWCFYTLREQRDGTCKVADEHSRKELIAARKPADHMTRYLPGY